MRGAEKLNLDISRDADENTINKTYRNLAMKYHRDRNPAREEAYDVLGDPEKRLQ